jgi:hypothetical protein
VTALPSHDEKVRKKRQDSIRRLLAASAIDCAERRLPPMPARSRMLTVLDRIDDATRTELAQAAADLITTLPGPPSLPAAEAERYDRWQTLLGGRTAGEQLSDLLTARVLLLDLRDHLAATRVSRSTRSGSTG